MKMKYMLMIYGDEAVEAAMSEAEFGALIAEHEVFTQEAIRRGMMAGGEALQPTHTATTVRVRDGKTLTIDGPFAETKEQLGGFYILDCKDLDEALEMAAKIPDARRGSVEVRPVMDLGG
jgi:hypothetical protein